MAFTRRAFLLALGVAAVPSAAYAKPRKPRPVTVTPPRLTVTRV